VSRGGRAVPPGGNALAPRATYRLQLSGRFGLGDAARLVPYLAALGVSHVYCSPYLRARAGSTHGYDIVDHNTINPELGGEAAFESFVAALRRHRMGHVLDFVPNHMGVARADNPWWLDVLEWGRAAPAADWFDIDWHPAKAELSGKVLLPFLGDHYGRVLERAELHPVFDPDAGAISVHYHEHRFPLAPQTYPAILGVPLRGGRDGLACGALEALLAALGSLPLATRDGGPRPALVAEGARRKRALARLVARKPAVRRWIDARLAHFARRGSAAGLHRVLERQHWRLAFWRVADDEINYRRFFNVNELAGLRVERAELFDNIHRLVFRLIGAGQLDGLRIDHVDGLFDPRSYCRRLAEGVGPRTWVIVEKILAPDEPLRDWAVAGTTGYDVLNLLTRVLIDPGGAASLAQVYARCTGDRTAFGEVAYQARKHVMNFLLGSELQVLANQLDCLSEVHWRWRDFTLTSLKEALKETIACFPVYRTYVDAAGAWAEDRRCIAEAVGEARRRSSDPETSLFAFLEAVLTGDLGRDPGGGAAQPDVLRFAQQFQQYTGPVMAKAIEDTSFYRQPALLALNEVGGDPRRAALPVEAFHTANAERLARWPDTMVATATHDTKRGEDVRARLAVLFELPGVFGARVRHWMERNRRVRGAAGGRPAPRPKDEYLLYQTLLGSWPSELTGTTSLAPAILEAYRERIAAYMVKAVREAKEVSSWRHPDAAYEEAVGAFVRAVLAGDTAANPFLADFLPFQARVAVLGVLNGLAQVTLKLTVPGVPDIYQGAESWDLSLVDPDNRRPVDFEVRAAFLDAVQRRVSGAGPLAPAALHGLLDGWRDGAVKLFVTARLLALRARRPALFARGDYVALPANGRRSAHVVAFARLHRGHALIVIVPRLPARLYGAASPLAGPARWHDTAIDLGAMQGQRRWRDVLTGAEMGETRRHALRLATALGRFPVAVLEPARDGVSGRPRRDRTRAPRPASDRSTSTSPASARPRGTRRGPPRRWAGSAGMRPYCGPWRPTRTPPRRRV
jgi:(1->4)-alpha-D-glucan 1-alpha-D-glucosylmutase